MSLKFVIKSHSYNVTYRLHPSTSLSTVSTTKWFIYPHAAVATTSIPPLLSLQYLLTWSIHPLLLLILNSTASIPPLLSLQYLLTWSIYPPAAVAPHPYHLQISTSFCLVSTNMVHLSLCCCCSCRLSASCYSS